MAEKITLFDLDINLNASLQASEDLRKTVNELKKGLKELTESEKENNKQIDEQTKRLIKLRDAEQQDIFAIAEAENNLTKLIGTRDDLNKSIVEQNTILKVNQKELRKNEKLNQDLIASEQAQAGSIEQLRKQLSVVSVEWAKLSEDERENTEEGKKLTKQKLDITEALKKEEKATGDTRRNVGNYAASIIDAVKQLKTQEQRLKENRKALLAYQKATKGSAENQKLIKDELANTDAQLEKTNEELKKYGESTGANSKSGGLFSDSLSNIGGGFGGVVDGAKSANSAFLKLLANPIVLFLAAIVGAIKLLVDAFKSTQEGADTFARIFGEISAAIDAVIGRIAGLAKNIVKLIKGEQSFDEFKKAAKDTFKGIREEIDETRTAFNSIFDLKIALEEATIAATKNIAELNKVAETQAAIADDATRSFQDREVAAQKAEKAVISARTKELELANKALEIVEKENDVKEKQGTLTRALRQQEADLAAAAIDAQTQLNLARIDASKRRSELAKDNFEQELDFLLDIVDATKTANERQLTNANKTLNERKKILKETDKLLEESFDQQIKLYESEFQIQLDRAKIQELNNKEIFEYARGLELSEIATNRLKEVIRERRIAQQDLADATIDLAEQTNQVELELNQKNLDQQLISQKEFNSEKLRLENEAAQERFDSQVISQEKLNQTLSQNQRDFEVAEKERIDIQRATDLQNQLEIQQDNFIAILELEREQLRLKQEQELEFAEKTGADKNLVNEKFRKADLQLDLANFNARASLAGDFAGNLVTIFGENSKIGKAAAVSQATIAAIVSANQAFSAVAGIPIVGPALGATAAAAALAAGFQNVKQILAVETPGGSDGVSAPSPISAPAPTVTNVNPEIGQGLANRNDLGLQALNENIGTQDKLQPTLVEDDVTSKQNQTTQNQTTAVI